MSGEIKKNLIFLFGVILLLASIDASAYIVNWPPAKVVSSVSTKPTNPFDCSDPTPIRGRADCQARTCSSGGVCTYVPPREGEVEGTCTCVTKTVQAVPPLVSTAATFTEDTTPQGITAGLQNSSGGVPSVQAFECNDPTVPNDESDCASRTCRYGGSCGYVRPSSGKLYPSCKCNGLGLPTYRDYLRMRASSTTTTLTSTTTTTTLKLGAYTLLYGGSPSGGEPNGDEE